MKKLLKLKVIILILSIFFASKTYAADSILPVPKPKIDEEIKNITAKKKEIYPKKKPINKPIKNVSYLTSSKAWKTQIENFAVSFPEETTCSVVPLSVSVTFSIYKFNIL